MFAKFVRCYFLSFSFFTKNIYFISEEVKGKVHLSLKLNERSWVWFSSREEQNKSNQMNFILGIHYNFLHMTAYFP